MMPPSLQPGPAKDICFCSISSWGHFSSGQEPTGGSQQARDALRCRMTKSQGPWLYYLSHLSSKTVHVVKSVKRTEEICGGGGCRSGGREKWNGIPGSICTWPSMTSKDMEGILLKISATKSKHPRPDKQHFPTNEFALLLHYSFYSNVNRGQIFRIIFSFLYLAMFLMLFLGFLCFYNNIATTFI